MTDSSKEREILIVMRKVLAQIIKDRGLSPEVVAGTATAGIPHGALLADLHEVLDAEHAPGATASASRL